MSTNQYLKTNTTCAACTKRLIKHKQKLQCCICQKKFHPKCVNLVPSDVLNATAAVYNKFWFCPTCRADILPHVSFCPSNINAQNSKSCPTPITKFKTCYTCSKRGSVSTLIPCDLCDNLSHTRCSAGLLGCKSCLRSIIPGQDCNPGDLFPNSTHNNAIFNPYSPTSKMHGLGVSNENFEYEDTDWTNQSDLLCNCKYIGLDKVTGSRPSELKVMFLNIRSLKDKITEIRDSLDHFSKFDIICFNETNCIPEKLPFGDTELFLENFYAPILQSPTRTSGRGGGLAIYLNKTFCLESDYKVLNAFSENSSIANGEYLFVEIS